MFTRIRLKKRYAARVRYYIVWFANNAGLYADIKRVISLYSLCGKGFAVVLNIAMVGAYYR